MRLTGRYCLVYNWTHISEGKKNYRINSWNISCPWFRILQAGGWIFDALQHWRRGKNLVLDVEQKKKNLPVAVTVRYIVHCDTQISWLRQWGIWRTGYVKAYLDTRDWRAAQTGRGVSKRPCCQKPSGVWVCIVQWQRWLGWVWWGPRSPVCWARGLRSSHWHSPQKG